MPTSLQSAIKGWLAILSSSQIVTDNLKLNDYNKSTFRIRGTIPCVLLPTTTQEVSECLKIANKYEVQIYVISKGQNYGLGSKLPVDEGEGAVLMDLSKMNKVIDFSEELAYITVQPGVTFKQVSEYLMKNKSDLMLDSIGSTGEASIIGNTAERGHGVALLADRFNHTCSMEIVLPTGEVINTGFAALGDSKLNALSKWGLGPSLDGIFTQSNLGIITKLNLWLQPKPSHFQILLFHIADDKNLQLVIDKLRHVRLQKLPFSLRIFNDFRMVGFSEQYPWKAMNNQTPISASVFEELKAKVNISGKWIGLGALYSINENFARAEKEYLKEVLSPYVKQIDFYDEKRATAIKTNGSDSDRDFINFIYFKSSLRGFTSERALNMCYWRMKTPIPENKDLHADQCGVLWYCPTIPNTGEDVQKAISIIEKTSYRYKMEPNIGFLFITERALDITGAICYDKSDPQQDELAKKCHDEIMNLFVAAGYPPYRLGIQSMHLIDGYDTTNKKLLKTIKSSLDPKNILSRGRYIPDISE